MRSLIGLRLCDVVASSFQPLQPSHLSLPPLVTVIVVLPLRIDSMGKASKSRKRPQPGGRNRKGEEIFCICRKTDDGSEMAECPQCTEWFHVACMTEPISDSWLCPWCAKDKRTYAPEHDVC
jgi:hypothetical protein